MKINFLNKNDINEKELLKNVAKVAGITAALLVTKGILPNSVLASTVDKGVKGADGIGIEVWKVVNTGSKWIMAGFAVKDILESLNDGDHKAIGKIMFKYGLAYAAIVFMIKYFTWINSLSER